MYILVVDDDESVRKAIGLLLYQRGHTVAWSATGEGALTLMRSEKPDLVLLDLHLPGRMSGWDVASEKLKDETLRNIPFIIITGDDTKREPANLLEGALLFM